METFTAPGPRALSLMPWPDRSKSCQTPDAINQTEIVFLRSDHMHAPEKEIVEQINGDM